jgi:hypothetical protein
VLAMKGELERMDNFELFRKLVEAESEDTVDAILNLAGYLNDDASLWAALGFENNFSAIGNQQSDPTGAMVEKVINAIDAILLARSFALGIDPEGAAAPQTMTEAVERFFGIRDGRISNLDSRKQRELADNIHLVAVGSKQNPNYLIIDRGEGQTPARFPDTFMSLMKSNKLRIPFVQGKFNSGGTGILQFCGDRNYQLIVSRRQPGCPVDPNDRTADLWGFTIVRRMLPSDGRRSSVYVYLAPGGQVPAFEADEIKVLPGRSSQNQAAPPYAIGLPFGTCVKLYNYRWRSKSLVTTEGRYELERFLHSPCLPFRLTEARDGYTANYYSTTVVGGWTGAVVGDDEGGTTKLEDGFPAYGDLTLHNVGKLPYQIAVFKEGTKKRHVPYGIFFVVNGQVHGALPSDFISRRLKFDYLKDEHGPLLVSVDCTDMNQRVREDFFMASRDRIRRNEVYNEIEDRLAADLKSHPGLQEINQRRRQQEMEKHLTEDAPLSALQRLLDSDPTLSSLFAAGDHLVTSTGPAKQPLFIGRKFPTFFRLSREPKGGLVVPCPLNRTCHVEFETDAVNDYFSRGDDQGHILIEPSPDLCEHSRLWNGRFDTRFGVPWNVQPGDLVDVTVTVNDTDREARAMPFVSKFTLKAEPEATDEPHPGGHSRQRGPEPKGGTRRGVVLALPMVKEVHKSDWGSYDPPFTQYDALQVRNDGKGGYDCYVNVDNAFLLTELARARDEEKQLFKHWFVWGLILAAMGMIRHGRRLAAAAVPSTVGGPASDNDAEEADDLDSVNRHCNGVAQVIIPIVRTLGRQSLN